MANDPLQPLDYAPPDPNGTRAKSFKVDMDHRRNLRSLIVLLVLFVALVYAVFVLVVYVVH
jgi:hypothetical protein